MWYLAADEHGRKSSVFYSWAASARGRPAGAPPAEDSVRVVGVAAATAGTDVSASLTDLTASIGAAATNVDGVTAAVIAVPIA